MSLRERTHPGLGIIEPCPPSPAKNEFRRQLRWYATWYNRTPEKSSDNVRNNSRNAWYTRFVTDRRSDAAGLVRAPTATAAP